jgi:SAM-dependent methyltransferase
MMATAAETAEKTLLIRQLLSERFEFKPAEPPANSSAKQRQMLGEFKRRLESGAYKLVHETCPCGGETESVLISEVDRYGLPVRSVLCLACGTVRINPYLDTPSLENFYSELYQELYGRALEPVPYFDRQRAYGKKVRLALFGDEAGNDRAVLEIGCGAGGGLSEFQKAGFRVVGCDFSQRLIDYGTQRGIRDLFVGGIAEVRKHSLHERFDFIFLHHVYEHVSEPIPLLREIRSMLAPDGRVLIIVPDLSRIDRFVNPAGNALDFFHIAHKYNYSVRGMTSIAQQAGFAALQVVPPRKMHTAWSRSPELWIQLQESCERQIEPSGDSPGRQLLEYLQRTENRYRWGLCPAQVAETVRILRPDRVISRWVRKLRRAKAA